MATSDLEVVNIALTRIGVEPILDLDDETDNIAVTAKTFYAQTRDHLLSQHFWNFAMKRTELAKDAIAPAFGWSARFKIPGDYLLMYETYPYHFNYEIEGSYILCNLTTLKMKYVAQVLAAVNFHPSFTEALTYALAARMAWQMTQSRSLMQDMEDKYQEVIRNAKSTDAIAAPMNELIDDTFLDSRVSGPQPYGRFGDNY